ncbi:MAG TPA: glycosyltransferase family 2 protein [Ignavibacteriaceae bacterium]|nr:glycosyltransferase family 2 protein [Ignavibacteriaceae bacterium]
MNKISVTIITKDEEKNISDCLKSVEWADEIIVVDSESTDRTVELAKKFTDKVFIRKWEGYVPQKRYALSLAANEWVLSLDADERVTEELKEEILNLLPSDFSGFRIRRKNFLLKKEITSCGWEKDYQLRLFKKGKTDLNERLVHEKFVTEGKVGTLKNPMLHFTFSSFEEYLAKINSYTSLKAQELFKKKKKVGGWTIFSHTISAFFAFFFIRRGFKDGVYGLIISLLHSVSTMMNYIKLLELQNKK